MFTEKMVRGNLIRGEIHNQGGWYTLPDGYSIKKAKITMDFENSTSMQKVVLTDGSATTGDYLILCELPANSGIMHAEIDLEFPIVNGKSPCTFAFFSFNKCYATIIIEEFGSTPDTTYFSDAFQPSDYNNLQIPHNRKE